MSNATMNTPLRILLVSHYFDPEPFRINQVAADLIAAGAELTVLTGQPNYPGGSIFPGYRARSWGRERHPAGYDVFRVPIVPRGAGGALRLVLNYLSFTVTGILLGSWLLRGRRFDTVFVYCTTPAIQGYVGLWFGLIKRARVVQWIQDLWPEALSATAFIQSRWVLEPIRRAMSAMYRASDVVLGQSHAFVRHLTPQAGRTPVVFFPNPGEHPPAAALEAPDLGSGFHIVFGGNMGKAQGMPGVLAAAELLRNDPDIRFILFGSGAMVPWIETEIARRGLSNVTLGGRMPPEAMPGIYAQAGALLLTLIDDPLIAQTVPSKLQSYLAAGVPIVVAVNGEAAEIVDASGAGIACPADDPAALAAAITKLKAMPAERREAMGGRLAVSSPNTTSPTDWRASCWDCCPIRARRQSRRIGDVKIVVLGATGMLGNAIVRVLAEEPDHVVVAVSRSPGAARLFPANTPVTFASGFDAESADSLTALVATYRPDMIVNCVGVVKQLAGAGRVLDAVPINTLLPHRLAQLCGISGARLVHVSTDCVFDGTRGNYTEADRPNALDLYGTSKRWGEVVDAPHAITLRTSIIGHELTTAHSLLGWFLAQSQPVRGFSRAIFSGLPTVELARVIRDLVIPRPDLYGLYHVSAAPIDKLSLLRLFASEYDHAVEIVPDDALVIDRSLDSTRFREATGYRPPAWPDLVATMRHFG